MIYEINKKECTGCSACYNICTHAAIQMESDRKGFLYPKINSSLCVGCKLCIETCPVSSFQERNDISDSYCAYIKDEKIRSESSSGGVFSAFAIEFLQNGGSVYGAAFDGDFLVRHERVDNLQELATLRGSKYSQSRIGFIFREVKKDLEEKKEVLFSGTPCQVAGLKAFLKKEYSNLLCIEIVCHSVASPLFWRDYVRHRSHKDNGGILPRFINERSKISGWTNYGYSEQFIYSKNKEHVCHNEKSLFFKLYGTNIISRESCLECKFKGDLSQSDITIGDCWGVWDFCPEIDDNKGTSAIIIHNQKANMYFERIKKELYVKQVSLGLLRQYNPALFRSFNARAGMKGKIIRFFVKLYCLFWGMKKRKE